MEIQVKERAFGTEPPTVPVPYGIQFKPFPESTALRNIDNFHSHRPAL